MTGYVFKTGMIFPVKCILAILAKSMGELGFRMPPDIGFNRLPLILAVSDTFTMGTNRDDSLQCFDMVNGFFKLGGSRLHAVFKRVIGCFQFGLDQNKTVDLRPHQHKNKNEGSEYIEKTVKELKY
ncbi:MAG: hypothetical protein WA081_14225 [Desulfosalsimonadaceae bacterium]